MMAATALIGRDTVALWEEYHRTHDLGIRNSLVLQNLGLVYQLANQHASLAGDSLDDMIQEGSLGLIRAVERFDPGYGVQFSTYAYPVISGAIKNYLRSRRRLLGRRGVGGDGASLELGGPIPTAEELLAPEQMELLAEGAQGDFADGVVERLLTGDLLGRLPATEQRIVAHFFYDDLTQREIARLMARSNSRVCRLLRRALERLRGILVEVQREEHVVAGAPEPELLHAASAVDMETGLFGPGHFRRCLAREIRRADALKAPLSLVLLRPSQAVEGDAARALVAAARHIYRNVRVLDHVFRAGTAELALIFSLPGSAAARVCRRIQEGGLPFRLDHAIGSFPEDARSVPGLVAATQAGFGRL